MLEWSSDQRVWSLKRSLSYLRRRLEVSEQSLEGVLDEGLEWREHAVVLGTAGRGSE